MNRTSARRLATTTEPGRLFGHFRCEQLYGGVKSKAACLLGFDEIERREQLAHRFDARLIEGKETRDDGRRRPTPSVLNYVAASRACRLTVATRASAETVAQRIAAAGR